jgi:starvation-inducible DNA-binding protein
MEVHIGINEKDRQKIAEELSRVLADTYMLYLKTHNYHWNVTGKLFHSLHEQFEEQYTELAGAVDEIAERIRVLGFHAPGTFQEFQELTSIEEDDKEERLDALEMVRRLVQAHEQVLRTCREALKSCDIDGGDNDEATIDLITQRLDTHSKAAWMLRSHLE